MALRDLDLDWDRRLDRSLGAGADHARPPGDPGTEVADDGKDGAGVDVHAADDEHVVAAAEHALAEGRPPALAGRALDAGDVAAEKSHDRHRLSRQSGVHELPLRAGLDLDR